MKKLLFIFIVLPVMADVNENILTFTASDFPTTVHDFSFTERVAAMAEGYAPFEETWDDNGNCISGCSYSGMNIETETARLKRDTAAAKDAIKKRCALNPAECAPPAPVQTLPWKQPQQQQPITVCTPNNPSIAQTQTVPLGKPLSGNVRITSHFQPARKHPVDGRVRNHNGTDMAAAIGTPVFSPAIGVVDRVWSDASCGKGLIVKHNDGMATGYCHLSDNSLVRVGDSVNAGCMIAKTGNTGKSTGPHLHYMMYLNGKYISPEEFF